jgi:hypothetical protein
MKWLDGYRQQNALSTGGTALAALLMKAKALWNHDAFFDYADRMQSQDEKTQFPKWLPHDKGSPLAPRSFDIFVDQMWNKYRSTVPDQPGGKDNLKWVWDADKRTGQLVSNPKGSN